MKKAELKALLFQRFQERLATVMELRNQLQAKLDKEVEALAAEYDFVDAQMLGDLQLSTSKPKRVRKTKEPNSVESESPKETESRKKKRIKHKRRQRKPGEPTIHEVLRGHLPAFLALVGANGKEFTVRQVFDAMVKKGLPDKRIEVKHVSLYLSQNAKQHGLKSEQRKVKREKTKSGKPLPSVITNFYKIARK